MRQHGSHHLWFNSAYSDSTPRLRKFRRQPLSWTNLVTLQHMEINSNETSSSMQHLPIFDGHGQITICLFLRTGLLHHMDNYLEDKWWMISCSQAGLYHNLTQNKNLFCNCVFLSSDKCPRLNIKPLVQSII